MTIRKEHKPNLDAANFVDHIQHIVVSVVHLLYTFFCNQKVKSIIVTEVTVRSPLITYSSQHPWNFLDMEVIMIKEDEKCLSAFQLKSIRFTFLQ